VCVCLLWLMLWLLCIGVGYDVDFYEDFEQLRVDCFLLCIRLLLLNLVFVLVRLS